MSIANDVVVAVLKDLEGRSGFDWWWDGIDPDIQNEIVTDLVRVVEPLLAAHEAAES